MQADKDTTQDYAGQQDGVNEFGCPIIDGQNATNPSVTSTACWPTWASAASRK